MAAVTDEHEMNVTLWWTSLTAAQIGLLDLLSPVERDRVAALTRPADQGRSMLGAALLRVVAARHLHCPPEAVLVERSCAECGRPHGAPRIMGPTDHPLPWVSLSHSGALVVVAASRCGPVGVDVQRVADLADPTDAVAWVTREARLKAGHESSQQVLSVREVTAPLSGYCAALAAPNTVDEVVAHHWDWSSIAGAVPNR